MIEVIMRSRVFWMIVWILSGMWLMYVAVNYMEIIHIRDNGKLQGEVTTLTKVAAMREKYIVKLKQDLNACQGSSASKEASLEDFYHELIYADRIDVTTFGDDGKPRRLIFDCQGR